jgi:hypothetical protein
MKDMVQIEWQGEIYVVFGQDLEDRSEKETAMTQVVRGRPEVNPNFAYADL